MPNSLPFHIMPQLSLGPLRALQSAEVVARHEIHWTQLEERTSVMDLWARLRCSRGKVPALDAETPPRREKFACWSMLEVSPGDRGPVQAAGSSPEAAPIAATNTSSAVLPASGPTRLKTQDDTFEASPLVGRTAWEDRCRAAQLHGAHFSSPSAKRAGLVTEAIESSMDPSWIDRVALAVRTKPTVTARRHPLLLSFEQSSVEAAQALFRPHSSPSGDVEVFGIPESSCAPPVPQPRDNAAARTPQLRDGLLSKAALIDAARRRRLAETPEF